MTELEPLAGVGVADLTHALTGSFCTQPRFHRHVPRLGEHTEEVLADLAARA